MPETVDPAPLTSPRVYRSDAWVRDLTFRDAMPDAGDGDPPVHVTSALLVNGEPSPVRVLHGPVLVTGGCADATVVSFLVHHEDVRLPDYDAEPLAGGNRPMLGGRECLIPPPGRGGAYRWDYEVAGDPESGVRVWTYVRSVSFDAERA